MPCSKTSTPVSGYDTWTQSTKSYFPSGPYATEAECLQACKEGACCEGTTCSVKPQCQCQGTGKVFKGVGTVCASVSCGCCGNGEQLPLGAAGVYVARTLDVEAYSACACAPFQPPPTVDTRCRDQTALFSQQGNSSACSRFVSGNTPDYGQVTGGVYLSVAQSSCSMQVNIGWPVNPCAANTQAIYYAWPFELGKTQYTASYFVFLFVNGSGGQRAVSSTASAIPSSPAAGYFYAGARWSIAVTVTFA